MANDLSDMYSNYGNYTSLLNPSYLSNTNLSLNSNTISNSESNKRSAEGESFFVHLLLLGVLFRAFQHIF